MAESTVVRTNRDTVIVISDSGAAQTYTVAFEPGDFSYDVPGHTVDLYLDRGDINGGGGSVPSIRKGDQQPMTLGFSAYGRDIFSSTDATLPDICEQAGFVDANWTSTLATSDGDVTTYDVAITVDGATFGESDKTKTFPFCSLRGSFAEGAPNTYTVAGTSYAVVPTNS